MDILKIIEYIRNNHLTKTEFCEKCNISTETLDAIIYYGKSVEFDVAERISDTMGIGVYGLYIFGYSNPLY